MRLLDLQTVATQANAIWSFTKPQRGQVMNQDRRLFALVFLALLLPVAASAQTSGSPASAPPVQDQKSMAEVAKQLNNPVADLWALNFQYNHYLYQGEATGQYRTQDLLNFQPVLPVHLTSDLNLINRPVFPFVFGSPEFEPGEGWGKTSGFGDMAVVSLLSPAKTHEGLIWGGGPTFILPTATNDALGQGKWQAGPAAAGLYIGKEWVFGALAQQWWSFAGAGDRQSTSSANI
jgi:hypothetical protein